MGSGRTVPRRWGRPSLAASSVPSVTSVVADAWSHDPRMVACAGCHFSGPQENPLAKGRRPGEFARQIEMRIWLEHDIHAEARRRIEPGVETDAVRAQDDSDPLASPLEQRSLAESRRLSRQICDNLGYDVSNDEGYARFRQNCLTCHGGDSSPQSGRGFTRTGDQQPGLRCQQCHQAGEEEGWVDLHWQVGKWRLLPPSEKRAYGFRNLVSMSAQGQWCGDCHVGNLEKRQFVTHDMYAAGHPPLPAFELQTYCDQMPQHWRGPAELYESLQPSPDRDLYFATAYPSLFGIENAEGATQPEALAWTMRKLLTGAIQSQRQSLTLLVQAAEYDRWGDYALYDCSACHHDLQSDSRRQQRGFPGVPGRPRVHVWPTLLLRTALARSEQAAAYGECEAQLTRAMSDQPFGDPDQVATAARSMLLVLDRAQQDIDATRFSRADARQLLLDLVATPAEQLVEYEAARVLIWSIRQLATELDQLGEPLDARLESAIQELGYRPGARVILRLATGRGAPLAADSAPSDAECRADYQVDILIAQLGELRDLWTAAIR